MLTSLYLSIGFTEELMFWMGRFSFSVALPLFLAIPSSIGVYETTKSSESLFKKTENEADDLSRQYFDGGSIEGRITDREEHWFFYYNI